MDRIESLHMARKRECAECEATPVSASLRESREWIVRCPVDRTHGLRKARPVVNPFQQTSEQRRVHNEIKQLYKRS